MAQNFRATFSLDNAQNWELAACPIPPRFRLRTFAPLPCASFVQRSHLDHMYFLNCFTIFAQVLYVSHTIIRRIFSWMLLLNVNLVSGTDWLSAQVLSPLLVFFFSPQPVSPHPRGPVSVRARFRLHPVKVVDPFIHLLYS